MLFARYYSLFRAKLENENLVYMCIAFMLNDKLYNYSKKMAKELPDEE